MGPNQHASQTTNPWPDRSVKPYGFVFRACTLVTFSSSTVQQSAVEWTPEHRPTPDLGTHASFPGHVHSNEPIVLTHSALGWHLQKRKESKVESR